MAGLALALFALLLVGGCMVVLVGVPLAVRSQESFPEEAEVEIAIPQPTPVPLTTMAAPLDFEATTTAGPGMPGFESEFQAPFGATQMVSTVLDTGNRLVFEVTVEQPADVTEEVLAANPLDAGPVDGVVHAAIPATVVLVESPVDPLPASDVLDWTIVGGASVAMYRPVDSVDDQFGCGALDDDLTAAEELSLGVESAGRVCITIPAADLDHPDTAVWLTVGLGEPFVWTR